MGTNRIVGIGGTVSGVSSADLTLRLAMTQAKARGWHVRGFYGPELMNLPMYGSPVLEESQRATREAFSETIRAANSIIIVTPSYHGAVSGLVKNALDYVEDLRGAPEPYFSGRRVGTIVTGHGWQGTVTALQGLRDIVHGLRGWPTPYGAGINTSDKPFDAEGSCVDDSVERQISMVLDHLANEDDSDEHIASLAETRLVQM